MDWDPAQGLLVALGLHVCLNETSWNNSDYLTPATSRTQSHDSGANMLTINKGQKGAQDKIAITSRKMGLLLFLMLPVLMADTCDNNVTLFSPVAGSTYCGPVDVRFDVDINSSLNTYVVVGLISDGNVTILQNINPGLPYSGRGLNVTIPWSRIAPYRGHELWVFADVGWLPKVPPAGSTITGDSYKSMITIDMLTARATRTLRVCP